MALLFLMVTVSSSTTYPLITPFIRLGGTLPIRPISARMFLIQVRTGPLPVRHSLGRPDSDPDEVHCCDNKQAV